MASTANTECDINGVAARVRGNKHDMTDSAKGQQSEATAIDAASRSSSVTRPVSSSSQRNASENTSPEHPRSTASPAAGQEVTQEADQTSNSKTIAPPSEIVQQARAAGKAAQASLTPAEKQAARKERRDRTRKAKLEQHCAKKAGQRSKGRRRGANRKKDSSGRIRAMAGEKNETPDPFDDWLGRRLRAWCEKVVLVEGSEPPEGCGEAGMVEFDVNEDEIAFPTSLTALQRRQVHGWAMQLALFHASSGDDADRHVIVSKTGEFQGKHLTRGGRRWYKEGVENPVVRRFALQEGSDKVAEPLVAALKRFSEEMEKRDVGFAKWVVASCPGPLDGSNLAEARAVLRTWPGLQDTNWTYVDTPEKLSSLVSALEACTEFGFDLEAHSARTFHGLTCLLQISTVTEDYVVDPLAEGMWDSMSLLRGVFSNPDILKIGHSIRSCDVPSLFRDFGIVIVNVVDTEEAAHALGDKQSGLATTLENAGVEELHDISGLKHSMQTCDWRERPLTSEKLFYARCDSHYLIPLWRLLRIRLLAEDTEDNREDAQGQMEVGVINGRLCGDRRLQEDQDRSLQRPSTGHVKEGSTGQDGNADFDLQVAGALSSSSPRSVSSPVGVSEGQMPSMCTGSGVVIAPGGPESPVALAQESWPVEWEFPEDCHKNQRSRSGSIMRSDLESIHECDSVGGGSSSRNLLESDFSVGLEEDDEEGQKEGSGWAYGLGVHNELRENGSISFGEEMDAGGGSGADDGLLSNDADEDEDEDLWEGWGEQAAEATEVNEAGVVDRELTSNDPGVAPCSPPSLPLDVLTAPASNSATPAMVNIPSAVVMNPDIPDKQPASSSQRPFGGFDEVGEGAATGDGTGMKLSPHDPVLQTDGIRLMWKAVYRAQLAASVLWRPTAEAQREGAHKERHFRTAMQRLTPPRWTDLNVRVYEDIYMWRDRTARRLDDGPSYVCSGDILIDVALALPTTLDDLRRVSVPLSPVLGTGNTPEAVELVSVVRGALGLPPEAEEDGVMNEVRPQAGGRWGKGVVVRSSGGWSGRGGLRNTTAFMFAFGVTVVAVGVMIGIGVRRAGRV